MRTYLCIPEVAAALAQGIGTAEYPPSADEIRELITAYAREKRAYVVAQRSYRRAGVRLGVSIAKRQLRDTESVDAVRTLMLSGAETELAKANEILAAARVSELIQEETDRVDAAIEAGDAIRLLQLFPAKELLANIAPKIGCRDAVAAARGAGKHLDVEAFAPLNRLRNALLLLAPFS